MVQEVSTETYRHAMRSVVSPVAVVTFATDEGPAGLTCTAICSASTQPPMLITCINRKIGACGSMNRAGAFVVNFLADDQAEIARRFSQSYPEKDLFSFGQWYPNESGALVLMDAASTFECQIKRVEELGAHCVFFGAVTAVNRTESNGLMYRDGFFRRLAVE